jgi:hypothetical protein
MFVNYSFVFLLVYVVVQKFDDQVNVSQNHAATAVTFAAELVESLASGDTFFVNEVEVFVPFVSHDLYLKF